MYYSNKTSIDGVRCTVSPEGGLGSGRFRARFERELASLEQIEAIHWNSPQASGDVSLLPPGRGYLLDDIAYDHATRTYHVAFHLADQHLGDVSGYQTRVAQLETDLAAAQEEASSAQAAAETAQQEITALEGSLAAAQAGAEQAEILAGKPLSDAAEARVLRMAIESAVVSLPDEEAADAPSLFQPWAVGQEVSPGDRRYYAPTGKLYKVREGQGHVTQADWTPDLTPALWAVVGGPGEAGTIDDPITAARGMEYTYGLCYLDGEDGRVYRCERIGEAEGGKITVQYLPHELVGQYCTEVTG